jgi:hypothetical protein
MIRRTLGDVRPELSRIAGVTGMSVTDPRILVRLNKAIQELMNEGSFPGVVDRWHINTVDGNVVLPSNLDMLLEITTDGVPNQIMSTWAEFVAYGPGLQEDLVGRGNNFPARRWCGCGGGNLYDRGEYPVKVDIPISSGSSCVCTDGTGVEWDGPWVLRQYADPTRNEESGSYSTIQGLDPDGFIIRSDLSNGSGTEWINGVRLEITSGSSFVETTQQFSKITAYTKPETNGYIRLTAWNGFNEVELSNYEPWETTPSYHRYFSPFLQSRRHSTNPCCRVVLARARRRFVPVKEDTDVLIIGNILALETMMIAQNKREAGDFQEYAAMKITAVDIMKKESISYTSRVRTPALTFQRGFSLGELPALR